MMLLSQISRRIRRVSIPNVVSASRSAPRSFHSSPLASALTKHQKRTHSLTYSWICNPDVSPHIRPSLALGDAETKSVDTGFAVTFLGTGAGVRSATRSNSATALRMGGTTYLLDAGEGVQTQLMLSALNPGDIRKIFVTHLHGDHVLGLPGLLMSLHLIAKLSIGDTKKSIQIYGPVGLYNFIATSLSLTYAELKYLNVRVYELTGGSKRVQHPGAHGEFKEFKHRSLQRMSIPMNPDGTWTLEEAVELTTPEKAHEFASRRRGMHVQAAEIHHLPKLQCFGYVIMEPTQPLKLDAEKATQLGIRPGKKYKLLKGGFPVQSDDGTREVQPEDVCIGDPAKPRKFALLGDCCGIPAPMVEICRHADVLVHEATLTNRASAEKVKHGGHSTPEMAGAFADHVQAEVLALNHISSSGVNANYGETSIRANEQSLIQNATSTIKGATRVQLAADLMEIVVPRNGFAFQTQANGQEESHAKK